MLDKQAEPAQKHVARVDKGHSKAKEAHEAQEAIVGLDAELVLVTPTLAKEWITKNKGNRKISQDGVKKYAADMREQRWKITGDAIRFDSEGNLIDGQHRLLACIDSDSPFSSFVVTGLPNVTRQVIDIGIKRTHGAVLGILGYDHSPQMASVAMALLSIKGGLTVRGRISTPEIIELIERHPDLGKSVDLVYNDEESRGALTAIGSVQASVAAVHYVASHLLNEPKRADAFVRVLKSGVPDYPGDAAHCMRESFIKRKAAGYAPTTTAKLGSICKAWNMFVKQVPVGKFQVTTDIIIDGLDVDKI